MNTDNSISSVRPEGPAPAFPTSRLATAQKAVPNEEVKAPQQASTPDPREVRRQMQEASEQLNKQMAQSKRDLSFSVDDVANKIVLTVKDKSGEVVRQIPSETALRLAHNLDAVKGLISDEQV